MVTTGFAAMAKGMIFSGLYWFQRLRTLVEIREVATMKVRSEIRLACQPDAYHIAEMSRDYIEYGLGWSWTPARVTKAVQHDSTNVVVVTRSDVIAAFGIMEYADEHAHLNLLAVHPDHRMQGLGGWVFKWLEKCAVVAGNRRVLVEARVDNPTALTFYRSQRFTEVGRIKGYYRGRVDAIRLEKQLSVQRSI